MRRVIDTHDEAAELRETFMARPARRTRHYDWGWPTRLRQVGTCEAVMYSSDKWKKPGDFTDYKHVAEGPQLLYVTPSFIVDASGRPMEVAGPTVRIVGRTPDSIALLAPIIGIQAQLYRKRGRSHYLPNGDDNFYELSIARAKLGAIKDPDSGSTFLVVFTDADGVLCLISGNKLAVEKDGIVG